MLAEEGERRGHLLDGPHPLTKYQERSLRAAEMLDPKAVAGARSAQVEYRARVDRYFSDYDVIATPATATPAFELGSRPTTIAGRRVGRLWGAFPFAAPFNVSGHPAIVLPRDSWTAYRPPSNWSDGTMPTVTCCRSPSNSKPS